MSFYVTLNVGGSTDRNPSAVAIAGEYGAFNVMSPQASRQTAHDGRCIEFRFVPAISRISLWIKAPRRPSHLIGSFSAKISNELRTSVRRAAGCYERIVID